MLELQTITKKYKDKTALEQVTLMLENGIYGLLGPNGAGKSTLMNIITGNIRPTEGRVCWKGKEIKAQGAYYRSILGYAPQQQGLYDNFTGVRFLLYSCCGMGICPGKKSRNCLLIKWLREKLPECRRRKKENGYPNAKRSWTG